MRKLFVIILFVVIAFNSYSQIIQLHYAGNNQKIIAAVESANKILLSEVFYSELNAIQKFDNTLFTGNDIVKEMQQVKLIEITEYHKKLTRATARTQDNISINTAKLNRDNPDIVNTLIHETIHATDWNINHKWDYTHRTQYEEIPPVSAPYVIGAIAERIMRG